MNKKLKQPPLNELLEVAGVDTKNKKIIIEYENNPRYNDNAVEAVANSIKEFGFKVPIIIDKNSVIIAGHTRLKASKKLGLKEVPCIIADDLSEEQVKAFRLADNKVGEIAEWNYDFLDIELKEIENINMDLFGFDLFEEEQEVIEDNIDIEKLKKDELKKILSDILSDKYPTTVIHEDKPLKNDVHPTMKPIKLLSPLIRNSSKKEEIVLDLFGGSGSTLISTEQLNRKCYTMELDPKYVDVIIDRWETFTGNKAIKLVEGKGNED